MLKFEQWLEVEKVIGHNKTIAEQMLDCWEYASKKTLEDNEDYFNEKYEDEIEELETANNELEYENDELGCKCDELENIVSKVKNITKEVLEFNKIMDDVSLRTKLESILDIIDDYY